MTARARINQIIGAVALLSMSAIPVAAADPPSTLPQPKASPDGALPGSPTPDKWLISGSGCIGTGGTAGEVIVSLTYKSGALVTQPIVASIGSDGKWFFYVNLDRTAGDVAAAATCDLYSTSIAYPALIVPATSYHAQAATDSLLVGKRTLSARIAKSQGKQYVEISGEGCAVNGIAGFALVTAKLPHTFALPAVSDASTTGRWTSGYPAEVGNHHYDATCEVDGNVASYQPIDFVVSIDSDGNAVITFADATGASTSDPALAATGADVLAALPYAGLLLISGLGLVWAGRRRSRNP
ncbi:MAG: LPXTG cell wall anchor domain-containing protein [Antricoccus sp.]